jgi:hypothetical protein
MIYENNWIFDSDFLLGKAGKHPETGNLKFTIGSCVHEFT